MVVFQGLRVTVACSVPFSVATGYGLSIPVVIPETLVRNNSILCAVDQKIRGSGGGRCVHIPTAIRGGDGNPRFNVTVGVHYAVYVYPPRGEAVNINSVIVNRPLCHSVVNKRVQM